MLLDYRCQIIHGVISVRCKYILFSYKPYCVNQFVWAVGIHPVYVSFLLSNYFFKTLFTITNLAFLYK